MTRAMTLAEIATRQPVHVDTFVNALEARWIEYGNVTPPTLRAAWADICAVFNAQVTAPSDQWPVIPAELGVGKTTAAKLYCAMLGTPHPGVLFVVRTIDQAEEVARDINAWAGDTRAFAYHSRLPREQVRDLAALAKHPVVVICHEAYERGIGGPGVSADKLDRIVAYGDGRRALAIIDEALDLVHESRVSRGDLVKLYQLPHSLQRQHVLAFDVLNAYGRALRIAPDDRHQALPWNELMAGLPGLCVTDADRAVAALERDVKHSNKIKSTDRTEPAAILSALRAHFARYRWTSGEGRRTAISGHRLLLMPPGTRGVILDATARLNNVYLHRPSQFDIARMPQVRDYSAVTLHVARVSDTGKESAIKAGAKRAQAVLDAVAATLGDTASRRVLAVTHKAVEEHYQAAGARGRFEAFDVAHWNRIDGRNTWSEYDTVVIASLPYWPVSTALNTYMAVKGVELSTDELNTPTDEVRAIRETTMAAQVAQAIGRIRLRTMTRTDGGCSPCDVFLRLPNSNLQRVDPGRVLDRVISVLPGIRVVDWSGQSTKLTRNVPLRARSKFDDRFVAVLAALPEGQVVPSREVRKQLGRVPRNTWARMTAAAREPGNPLAQTISTLGVTAQVGARHELWFCRGVPPAAAAVTRGEAHVAALVERLDRLAPGETVTSSDLREQIGVPAGSWSRMLAAPAVQAALVERGVTYVPGTRSTPGRFTRG